MRVAQNNSEYRVGLRGYLHFNKDTREGTHTHGRQEKKRTQERVGSVAVENSKKAGREAQGTQGLSKKCTNRYNVSLLPCLIRGFGNEYKLISPWEDQNVRV